MSHYRHRRRLLLSPAATLTTPPSCCIDDALAYAFGVIYGYDATRHQSRHAAGLSAAMPRALLLFYFRRLSFSAG